MGRAASNFTTGVVSIVGAAVGALVGSAVFPGATLAPLVTGLLGGAGAVAMNDSRIENGKPGRGAGNFTVAPLSILGADLGGVVGGAIGLAAAAALGATAGATVIGVAAAGAIVGAAVGIKGGAKVSDMLPFTPDVPQQSR